MKEIFVAFSKYNQSTNDIIFSFLLEMTFDQMSHSIDAYYANIIQTTFHVMNSDIKWLNRISKYIEFNIGREIFDKFLIENKIDEAKVYENLQDYKKIRNEIDKEIIELVQSIPEEDFQKEIEIPFGGKTIRLVLWKLLLQWFNHHTHHRGQVSVQLDILGIENDYSLLLDKID
jgi:uncharacterized damage-inducible protein DinB